MALPITGRFLQKVYDNGSLGVNREDKFKFTTTPHKFKCRMPDESSMSTTHEISEESFKDSDFIPDEFIEQEGDFF
jgi:hypothetical protein